MWKILGVSLLLSIILEVPIALLFHTGKKDILLVALVNIITNPLVVLLAYLTGNHVITILLLEVIAIFTEGWYYKQYSTTMRLPFALSACANVFSFLTGTILSRI